MKRFPQVILSVVWATALLLGTGWAAAQDKPQGRLPNFVIIFADDLGYGDLGCYGHPTIRTPELDRMAREGLRMTQFYAAASVCTPSRAGLLTGRLPVRSGMCSDRRRVLFSDSKGGLPESEITLAEALKAKNYHTACIGKWHLGHLPQYLPTSNGFDSYFGIPYSNDMDRLADSPKGMAAFLEPKITYWNVPLMRDEQIVERPADQTTITRRYTEEAVRFIQAHREEPFFLYLAHNMPHVPLFRSREFVGHSARGLFGDVVEEIDWSVGRVLQTLRDLELDRNTLVVFTSDNGPWLIFGTQGGSAGLLREGKGCTWDGGMREPALLWWPGTVPADRVAGDIAGTTDLFATFLALADIPLPTDRVYDSIDMTPLLKGEGPGSRQHWFYYRGDRLMAVRKGPWKLHFQTQSAYGGEPARIHDPPLLFQIEHDPSEQHNVNSQYPEVIADILRDVEQHRRTVEPVASQLER